MPRRLSQDWQALEPVTQALHHLTHTAAGIRDEDELRRQPALLDLPAVRQGWREHPDKPRRAVEQLLSDVRWLGGDLNLNEAQFTAVKVLLFAQASVNVHGKEHALMENFLQRGRLAGELLGKSKFRDRDNPKDQPPSSPESRLMSAFAAALDRLDAPPAVTAHLAWTPTDWPMLLPAGSNVSDLVGTWPGVTDSDWLLKEQSRNKSGTFPCAMSIVQQPDGGIEITWFYPAGKARAVALRIVGTDGERRMLVIYESTTDIAADNGRPTHRGVAMLDIQGHPARRIHGPYWSDRLTSGTLTFAHRSLVPVASYAGAVAVLGLPSAG